MADFCTHCSERLGFPIDLNLEKIFMGLQVNTYRHILCEGCDIVAVGNDNGRMFIDRRSYPNTPERKN